MNPYIGQIALFAFGKAPPGWLPCDGRMLSIGSYSELFSLFGTSYGGNATSTFALPDLRGRVAMMGNNTKTPQGTTVGATGGQEQVTLAAGNMPQHGHTFTAQTQAGNSVSPSGMVLGVGAGGDKTNPVVVNLYSNVVPRAQLSPASVGATGGGQAHDNMQPYLTLAYYIAAQGIFPSHG